MKTEKSVVAQIINITNFIISTHTTSSNEKIPKTVISLNQLATYLVTLFCGYMPVDSLKIFVLYENTIINIKAAKTNTPFGNSTA